MKRSGAVHHTGPLGIAYEHFYGMLYSSIYVMHITVHVYSS